jgi:hypothetical protein
MQEEYTMPDWNKDIEKGLKDLDKARKKGKKDFIKKATDYGLL